MLSRMDQMINVDATTPAYYVAPEGARGAIVLIHEIWGLNEHTKDVARRLGEEGYAVLAPDVLEDTGITRMIDPSIFKEMADPATRNEAQKRMRDALAPMHAPGFAQRTLARLLACHAFLQDEEFERIAVMGFCFGGTYSFALAAHAQLRAAIPFYGHPPSEEDLARVSCPVLAFYGAKDENLMSGLPELERQMKAHKKDFTAKVYEGTGHAFFNDTNEMMYNADAAKDAWKRALEFLKRHM